MNKKDRVKEAMEGAEKASLLELGYGNYKLCKAIPKIYHPFSFIMAVIGVVSASAIYLQHNSGVFSWIVAVSCSILATIIFFFLESWKKAYTPEYFRSYFNNEYVATSYSIKMILAYLCSFASTVFSVYLTSIVAQDNSVVIDQEYKSSVAAIESRVKADTISANASIIEYKAANQIHINSTKTVLNPNANTGLQLLLEAKKNTIESARAELQELKQDKVKDQGTMFDSSRQHATASGIIYLVFELLTLGASAYTKDRDVQISNYYTEEEEEKEEEQEQEKGQEKAERNTPSYEKKYPNVVSMIREGVKDIDIMKESGVAKTTFYRIKKEVA